MGDHVIRCLNLVKWRLNWGSEPSEEVFEPCEEVAEPIEEVFELDEEGVDPG